MTHAWLTQITKNFIMNKIIDIENYFEHQKIDINEDAIERICTIFSILRNELDIMEIRND